MELFKVKIQKVFASATPKKNKNHIAVFEVVNIEEFIIFINNYWNTYNKTGID